MEVEVGVEMASTVVVRTFDEGMSAQVAVKGETVLAEDFVLTVGEALGLKRSSIKFFGIFQGLLHPTKKFKSIDQVPMDATGLTFQKWCFDSSKESKLLNDPVAARLVYAQCKAYIQKGLLKPTEEPPPVLQGGDASSAVKDYITKCQDAPGYNTVHLSECTLQAAFDLLPSIAAGSPMSLTLLLRGMVLEVAGQDGGAEKEEYFVSWRKVQRWRKSEDDESLVTYDIYSVPSDNCSCLSVQTQQANYLLSATVEMIKGLQSELEGPIFQTSDLIRNKKREVIEWKNIVFSPKRFNAEREIAEQYVEVSMLR